MFNVNAFHAKKDEDQLVRLEIWILLFEIFSARKMLFVNL